MAPRLPCMRAFPQTAMPASGLAWAFHAGWGATTAPQPRTIHACWQTKAGSIAVLSHARGLRNFVCPASLTHPIPSRVSLHRRAQCLICLRALCLPPDPTPPDPTPPALRAGTFCLSCCPPLRLGCPPGRRRPRRCRHAQRKSNQILARSHPEQHLRLWQLHAPSALSVRLCGMQILMAHLLPTLVQTVLNESYNYFYINIGLAQLGLNPASAAAVQLLPPFAAQLCSPAALHLLAPAYPGCPAALPLPAPEYPPPPGACMLRNRPTHRSAALLPAGALHRGAPRQRGALQLCERLEPHVLVRCLGAGLLHLAGSSPGRGFPACFEQDCCQKLRM